MIFDGEDSFTINKHSGEINYIEDDGHNFIVETWVVPPEEMRNIADDAVVVGQR